MHEVVARVERSRVHAVAREPGVAFTVVGREIDEPVLHDLPVEWMHPELHAVLRDQLARKPVMIVVEVRDDQQLDVVQCELQLRQRFDERFEDVGRVPAAVDEYVAFIARNEIGVDVPERIAFHGKADLMQAVFERADERLGRPDFGDRHQAVVLSTIASRRACRSSSVRTSVRSTLSGVMLTKPSRTAARSVPSSISLGSNEPHSQ